MWKNAQKKCWDQWYFLEWQPCHSYPETLFHQNYHTIEMQAWPYICQLNVLIQLWQRSILVCMRIFFRVFQNKKNLSCYTNSIWPHSAWTNQARWAQTKILFIQLGHSASWVKARAHSNPSLLWIIIHLKKYFRITYKNTKT